MNNCKLGRGCSVQSKVVNIPEHHQEDKLQDLIAELNIKYTSSYVFVEEFSSRKKLKILSILSSQVDEIARLTETRIGSMRLNFVQSSGKRDRKPKFKVDVQKLVDTICVYGLPPIKVMGSMTTVDGYWTRVCRELTGRKNPSYEYIKVVYSYWNNESTKVLNPRRSCIASVIVLHMHACTYNLDFITTSKFQ